MPCTEEYAAEAISALELTEKQEEQESKKSKTKKKNKKTKVAAVVKESEMKRRQLEDQKATAVGSAKRCLPAEWMCEAMEVATPRGSLLCVFVCLHVTMTPLALFFFVFFSPSYAST